MVGDKLCQRICSFRSPSGYCGKTGACVLSNATQRTQRVERVEDVVAVIRCKDCKWWKYEPNWNLHFCTYVIGGSFVRGEEDYCSRGERKDQSDIECTTSTGTTEGEVEQT